MLSRKSKSEAHDKRLSELVRLKRLERPDAKFWDSWDRELRNRQLTALVRTRTLRERIESALVLALRKSAIIGATASIFALGLFTLHRSDYFAQPREDLADQGAGESLAAAANGPSDATPIFVVDNFDMPLRDPTTEAAPAIVGIPNYEVYRITKQSMPVSYEIMAEPKQFRTGREADGESLGAKVIRTGIHF